MKFNHDLDIINVNNITISIFVKMLCIVENVSGLYCKQCFTGYWPCGFNTGQVKHPIDGETSYHYSTNQMNCYIDDTIFTL